MTFIATLFFGAGTLLLISAIEDTPFLDTIRQILSGNLTITSAAQRAAANNSSSSGGSGGWTGVPPTPPDTLPHF